jgi:hypothetical protein
MHLLLNLGYQEVLPEPVLQTSDGRRMRPDFVLMPSTEKLCDILELRLPRVRLIVGDHRRRISLDVANAIASEGI